MRPLPTLLPLLAIAALPLVGCRAPRAEESTDLQYLIRHQMWRDALDVAARQAESNPNDAEAQAVHRRVSVAVLLEQGRRLTFEDQDDEALAAFEAAREIEPESEHVLNWIDKTRRKLGRRWYERGSAAHADDNLAAAREGYEKALEYIPDNPLAKEGLATAILQINYRLDLSDQYYNDGIKAVSGWKYIEAHSRFDYSRKYRPEDQKRIRRLRETAEQLARERVIVAKTLEDRELFGAAYGDYRVATLMDEDNEDAQAGLERTRIEAEAAKLRRQGDMFVLRGEFTNAEEAYRSGRSVTLTRQDVFDEAIDKIDDARIAQRYEDALLLEHDFRYEDALGVYDEILSTREFYEDVLARRSTLRDYVEDAAELYEQAADAATPQERADLLRQIEIFWPEYRDTPDQLEVLREMLEAAPDDPAAPDVDPGADDTGGADDTR